MPRTRSGLVLTLVLAAVTVGAPAAAGWAGSTMPAPATPASNASTPTQYPVDTGNGTPPTEAGVIPDYEAENHTCTTATPTATPDLPDASTPTETPTETPTLPEPVDTPTPGPETDPDDDGLTSGRERELGTDPTEIDTDGDGIGDGVEVDMERADPLAADIFIEIDRTNRTEWLSSEEREHIRSSFNASPYANPDGSRAVDIHLIRGDVVGSPDGVVTYYEMMNLHHEHKDAGPSHHYVVLASEVRVNGRELGGYAAPAFETAMVDGDEEHPDAIFVHEVGHLLGLSSDVYRGIDSREVSYEDYPSAMNYNSPTDATLFSTGGEFDDWRYLNEHGFPMMVIYPSHHHDAASTADTQDSDDDE